MLLAVYVETSVATRLDRFPVIERRRDFAEPSRSRQKPVLRMKNLTSSASSLAMAASRYFRSMRKSASTVVLSRLSSCSSFVSPLPIAYWTMSPFAFVRSGLGWRKDQRKSVFGGTGQLTFVRRSLRSFACAPWFPSRSL